jgi:hypothetical protein
MLPTFVLIGAMKSGTTTLHWYLREHPDTARGEASVRYASYPADPQCPSRMASVLPDVRLLYVVRDPIDRMRSHYLHDFIGVDPSWRPRAPGRRDNETARRFLLPVVVRRGIGLAVKADVYRHVPQWTKKAVRTITQRRSRVAPEVQIPPDLAAELRTALADELRRLDGFTGERPFP